MQRGGLFWSNFWLGLAAIGLWPLWVLMRSWSFEKERWMESEFNPYTVSSDDDECSTGNREPSNMKPPPYTVFALPSCLYLCLAHLRALDFFPPAPPVGV